MSSRLFPARTFPTILSGAAASLLLAMAGCKQTGVSAPAAAKPAADAAASAPVAAPLAVVPAATAVAQFHQKIEPILKARCYDCHGDGEKKGDLAFDKLTAERIAQDPSLWLKVLKNTRAGLMPPLDTNNPLTADERAALEGWIKTAAFGLDPAQPDPGRVTVRRLNRTEYRNTVRDLVGLDFDVDQALPPDDVGYGFDNIGDVLSVSPIRMEKFLAAAQSVIERGVPQSNKSIGSQQAMADQFLSEDGQDGQHLSFYQYQEVSHTFRAKVAGDYRIIVSSKIDGEAQPVDPQVAKVTYKSDGKAIRQFEYPWNDALYSVDDQIVRWEAGEHRVSFAIEPLHPELQPLRTKMEYRLIFVAVEGPLAEKDWELPANYRRFYSRDIPPEDPAARRVYAREVLEKFATRAYRRPVAADTLDRLVAIAEQTYAVPGTTFEKGVAQAMVAVLASPRFLFRVEEAGPVAASVPFPEVDEYSLASRLSYFLWSSMPDDELFALAAKGELRKNLQAQVKRMIADPKSVALVENFPGQWLQSRAVMDMPINTADVLAAERAPAPAGAPVAEAPPPAADPAFAGAGARAGRGRGAAGAAPGNFVPGDPVAAPGNFAGVPPPLADAAGAPQFAQAGARGARGGAAGARGGRGGRGGRGAAAPAGMELTPEVRLAMRQEAEAYFAHIVRHDRSVLELIDSDYTFVNEPLAAVYGIPNITGPELRQVTLAADSLRGGVLTMGSVLTVTSNPTRTSPVKRGKWILENILGAPSAPPPPDVPGLEKSEESLGDRKPTQRELIALHRADPLCSSCHERMDPLGLALENFNAFGRQRALEFGQPIDTSGELATGEKIADIRDLKKVIVAQHRSEFYHLLAEKLMTYALGRGVEHYDVPTLDAIVARLEREEGRFSALLMGIIESPSFQRRRAVSNPLPAEPKPATVASNQPAP
jgi:hypothetical protein